ncbi:hypothetical protein L1049_011338 [Liquidambar formosana]|uniref:Peroxidase n=1 Tax=Liquidambar formosana TaxID=63359 RepID=A0AAP0RR50_LIQFO
MASSSSSSFIPIAALTFLVLFMGGSTAQLTPDFYFESCPQLFFTVRYAVYNAIMKEARMGASLLRLHFHDCFVNGCDGSVLLDDTPTFKGEKTAAPNFNSIRGFDVVDDIKSAVEQVCPGVVSCADLLAIIARESVSILGGPYWSVKLGRRDARTASQGAANVSIPPPTSSLNALASRFQALGLSTRDLVALYGAHTIGQARCTNFRAHIYNDTNIDGSFAKMRQANCPKPAGSGDNNLGPLDYQTPTVFDNTYYQGLLQKKALLHSDQELFNGGYTDSIVQSYSSSQSTFYADFVTGIIKMGDLSPLTGSNGEIRKHCRRVNQ